MARFETEPYTPYPDQNSGGGGGRMLDANANPADFGGQIGGALEKAGAQTEDLGKQGLDLAIQQQGLLNETLATQHEVGFKSRQAQREGDFRSKEGLAAVAALPDFIKQSNDDYNNTYSSLPAGAAKAFAMPAIRALGGSLDNASLYSVSQNKQANTNAATSGLQMSVNETGSLDNAMDDSKFGYQIGSANHFINILMQNQGWGANTGMTQDAKTGQLKFDDSPSGQQAKSVYEEYQTKYISQMYENRYKALADQNVEAAYLKYQENRDSIPGPAQLKLDAMFTPKISSAQSDSVAQQILSGASQQHTALVSSPAAFNSDKISSAILGQESGNNPNIGTSVNGAVGIGQIIPATFNQYAKPGEDIHNPSDNLAVSQRIVQDYTKKYNGDAARVAVAYFSGPRNVAAPGSPTPWINDTQDGNGKSVSSYVSDVTNRLGTQSGIPTLADYYSNNKDALLNQARATAQSQRPGDLNYEQSTVAKTEAYLNNVITQQVQSRDNDKKVLNQAIYGGLSNGTRPTSVQQLQAISPEVKQAWENLQQYNPTGAQNIENNVLVANSGQGYTKEENQMNLQLAKAGFGPLNPTPSQQEATAYINSFNAQPPEIQKNMLATFAKTYGNNTQYAARVFEKISPNFGTAAALVASSNGNPNDPNILTAYKILNGDARIRQNIDEKNGKDIIPWKTVDQSLSSYKDILPADIYDQVRSASRSVYMADNATPHGGNMDDAVKSVIGSDIANVNGVKTLAPVGVQPHVFENVINSKPDLQRMIPWISAGYQSATGKPLVGVPAIQDAKGSFNTTTSKYQLKWIKQNTYRMDGMNGKPYVMNHPDRPGVQMPVFLQITAQNLGQQYANK